MFNSYLTVEKLNENPQNMVGHLGIEFIEVSEGCLKATMPVDDRTKQPMGLLHGGASAVLAETLGSVGALCYIDMKTKAPVGLEINCNHIKSVREGIVTGTATPVHLGRRTHVWEIKIHDEKMNLICISRMTVAIIDRK